jgi:hypothetical protein
MKSPDWLEKRMGTIRPGLNAQTWNVVIDDQPLYRLFSTTANGRFTCTISCTNNGKRLDDSKLYPSMEAAITGGLEELRDRLGW